jgi:hypothetical protein
MLTMNTARQISRNQSLSVTGRRGMTVRVASGRIWLTRDGDIRDYILNAGDSLEIAASGRVVAFGLTEAFVQVDTPERAPGLWTGFLARLTWMGERA